MDIDLWRQRQLDQDPVDPVVGVERVDFADQRCLAGIGRQAALERDEPGGAAGIALGADIAAARRVVADEDGGEAGGQPVFPAQARRRIGNTEAQPCRDGLSVDDPRIRHAALPRRRSSNRQNLYPAQPANA